MPFTPFHFGPGLVAKACAPRVFWLTSFVAANVLIDLEVLYYLWADSPPIHRHLHAYAGGLSMGLAAGLSMFVVVLAVCRIMPTRFGWSARIESTPKKRLLRRSLIAGTIGGISHIILDSLIHHDMNPFWPFASGNGLAGFVGTSELHIGLAVVGFFGCVLWAFLRETK